MASLMSKLRQSKKSKPQVVVKTVREFLIENPKDYIVISTEQDGIVAIGNAERILKHTNINDLETRTIKEIYWGKSTYINC